jgi:uncharacterized protein
MTPSQDETRWLILSANSDDIAKVQAFFKKYPGNIDVWDPNFETTAFKEAAKTRSIAVMRFLLQSGADVNQVDSNGWSALMHAAYHDDMEATRLLLEYDADTRLQNEGGTTALDIAKGFRADEIADLLIASEQAREQKRIAAEKEAALKKAIDEYSPNLKKPMSLPPTLFRKGPKP